MEPISFQEVKPEHLRALAEILNYYVVNTTVTFHTGLQDAADMESKVFFDNPRFKAFLILQEDQTIGYCAISPWKKQEAYAHTGEINIYLAHDYTGKGIGSLAVTYLLEYARANHINNLIAGLCSENTASQKLFEKNGFRLCAHFQRVGRKFGRDLDTVYLQRMLD